MEEQNIICRNCYQPTPIKGKFCENCGTELVDNKPNNKSVIVSTGDIRGDYEILKPVHLFHHSLMNEVVFKDKKLTFDKTIDEMIEVLKVKTIEAGGNGIINLRVDFEQMPLGGTQYFVYGTMVKMKESE